MATPAARAFRRLIVFAMVVASAAVVAAALGTLWLRAKAIQNSSRNADNLAFVLAEQTARAIQSIDLLLNDLQERITALGANNAGDFNRLLAGEEIHQLLENRMVRLSHIYFISVVNKDGRLINSTNPLTPANVDISDRAHFQFIKNNDLREIYVSDPIVDRVQGTRAILFNKRVTDVHNNFLGVLVIGVRLSYFEDIYQALGSLRDFSFLLLRKDGTVIIRHPDPIDRAGEKIPAGSPWYQLVAQGGGFYRSPGYFDGIPRNIAVHPLHDYGIVVNVAASENAALSVWRIEAISICSGTLLLIACVVFLLRALSAQFQKVSGSEAKLVEKAGELEAANAKVDAALSNISQGLVMFDREHRLVICNKRYAELYRMPQTLTRPGTSLINILEHRAANGIYGGTNPNQYVADGLSIATSGKLRDSILELSDGRALFIVHRPMEGGGWVSTHEDITDRRRAEAKVDYMAHHDLLTGLPNRVFFRQRLERALDSLAPGGELAVLYFDLDQFKSVNDMLGHLAGDELLKNVATRLRACLPETDFAGRLGGDEFAIVAELDARKKRCLAAREQGFGSTRNTISNRRPSVDYRDEHRDFFGTR